MKKLDDKLNKFLKNRKFTHTVETVTENKYTDEEVEKLKKIYGKSFDATAKGQSINRTEVVDDLTPDELDLLMKLDASDDRSEIKDRLKKLEDKISNLQSLESQSESHLRTIKTIMLISIVVAAVSALITVIQACNLSSMLG